MSTSGIWSNFERLGELDRSDSGYFGQLRQALNEFDAGASGLSASRAVFATIQQLRADILNGPGDAGSFSSFTSTERAAEAQANAELTARSSEGMHGSLPPASSLEAPPPSRPTAASEGGGRGQTLTVYA